MSDFDIYLGGGDYPCKDCQIINYAFTNDVEQKVNQQIGECPICYEEKQISRFCDNNHYFCDDCMSGKYENYDVTEQDKPIFPYEEEIEKKYVKFINEGKYFTEKGLIDVDQNYQQKLKKKYLNSNIYIESEEPEYFGNIFNRNYNPDSDEFFSVFIENNEKKIHQGYVWENEMITDYTCKIIEWEHKKQGIEKQTIREPETICPLCRKHF